VTAVTYLFIVNKKKKKKIIKLRKIDKRKRKILVLTCIITNRWQISQTSIIKQNCISISIYLILASIE